MGGSRSVKKIQDLTQMDPEPDDGSYGFPLYRTGEKIIIESHALPQVATVLGSAVVIHVVLDVPGTTAVLLSLGILFTINQAKYATRIVRWFTQKLGS